MAEQKHLWAFQDFEKNMTMPLIGNQAMPNIGPAPMLSPEFTNDDIFEMFSKKLDKKSYTVNVVKDFPWTVSPQNAESIGDVPEIHLRELNVEFNPAVNQILNNLAILSQQSQRVAEVGAGALDQLIGNLKIKDQKCTSGVEDASPSEKNPGLQSALIGGFDFLNKKVDALKNKELKGFKVKQKMNDPDYDPMAPYDRLYETSPTGWKYKFPFFDDNFRSIGNSWSASTDAGFMSGVASATEGMAQQFSTMLNSFEPGVYIEKPKGYAFGSGGNSVTISFPLINTRTYDEMIRNWQLIYLLSYQNLPNRVSRSLIIPPVIYEALIPGMWYSKYSYISNLTVNFIGARRKMTMRIPSVTKNVLDDFLIGQTDLTTVIPDAFNVTMTINELFPEAQNHMYTALKMRHLNSKVRTGERDSEGTIIGSAVGEIQSAIGNISDAISNPLKTAKKLVKKTNAYKKIDGFIDKLKF